jgi:hypothetical protein
MNIRQEQMKRRAGEAQRGVPTLRRSGFKSSDFESTNIFIRFIRYLWRL